MKQQMKKLVAVICCIIFAFIFTKNIWADYVFYTVDETQEKTDWCWVACARGLAKQEGIVTASQADAVKAIKGKVLNVGGSVEEIVAAAKFFAPNKNFVVEYRQLSFEEIVALIDNGHIISASCGYFIGTYRMGGHSVLITGYNSNDGEQWIRYFDPLTGETVNISYELFCEHSIDGKKLIYQQSVYCTEDEVEVASISETKTEETSSQFDLGTFVLEWILEVILFVFGCIAVGIIIEKNKKRQYGGDGDE